MVSSGSNNLRATDLSLEMWEFLLRKINRKLVVLLLISCPFVKKEPSTCEQNDRDVIFVTIKYKGVAL